jgi:hypothetical protein
VKKINLAVALAAVATMAVTSSASAGVERYQEKTFTITAVQPEGVVGQFANVWTHTYTVTLNPCDGDGSFEGVGEVKGTINGPLDTETITGNLDLVENTVSFVATRDSDDFEYTLVDAPLDGTVAEAISNPEVPWVLEFKVTAKLDGVTDYKNHGEYVAAQGGGSDAAHWCIGMPVRR